MTLDVPKLIIYYSSLSSKRITYLSSGSTTKLFQFLSTIPAQIITNKSRQHPKLRFRVPDCHSLGKAGSSLNRTYAPTSADLSLNHQQEFKKKMIKDVAQEMLFEWMN